MPKRIESRRGLSASIACAAATALFVVAPACNKKSGASSSTSGSGGKAAAASFQSSDCGKCVQTSCGPAISTCQADATCAAYLDCLYKCPVDSHGNADANCDAACVPAQTSTESSKARQTVEACRFYADGATMCPSCGIPNMPQSGTPQQCTARPNPPTACDACYWQKCCTTWDACYNGQNPDCDMLATCIGGCQTHPREPCLASCFSQHANSVQTLASQWQCALEQCSSDQPNCDASQRDACTTCTNVTCGAALDTLQSTGPGILLFACSEDCGAANMGPDCLTACANAHPEARDAFYLWAECVYYRCTSVC